MGGPPPGQATWVNTHLVYTHGFGFAAAYVDAVQGDGDPAFTESDIPPHGALGSSQPRVYFGEQQNAVRDRRGTAWPGAGGIGLPQRERERPAEQHLHRRRWRPVGSLFSRLLYAVKFHEPNILLSAAINS